MNQTPDHSPQFEGLLGQARSIILNPAESWEIIARRQRPIREILFSWVLPLAAIGPLAGLIGSQIFGYGAFGFHFRPSLASALFASILSYALAIAAVFILAVLANFLSPRFGGQTCLPGAIRLVAYSASAAWLAGIFQLVPALSILGLLGLYSIYLFYLGAGPMMQVPDDKRLGYTALTMVLAIVLNLAFGAIATAFAGSFGGLDPARSSAASVTVPGVGKIKVESDESNAVISVPGVGTIDTREMERSARQMERAAKGELPRVKGEDLLALLPASFGEFALQERSTTRMGNLGSRAKAVYQDPQGRQLTLTISDSAALGALGAIGSNFDENRETATGYERAGMVDGVFRTEKWNRNTRSGEYSVLVADRFLVEAKGSASSPEELRKVAGLIDKDRLASLAQ